MASPKKESQSFGVHERPMLLKEHVAKLKQILFNKAKASRAANDKYSVRKPTKVDLIQFVQWANDFQKWKDRIEYMCSMNLMKLIKSENVEQKLKAQFEKLLKLCDMFNDMMKDFFMGMSWFNAVATLAAASGGVRLSLDDITEMNNNLTSAWIHISTGLVTLLRLRSVVRDENADVDENATQSKSKTEQSARGNKKNTRLQQVIRGVRQTHTGRNSFRY
ncbi:uncharacterized protein LOC119679643 [Teleopsis dalmanni]|uniref:uncharacterized protein LOC119679643 n=1 Tax=Teleopsis dalmanni TaxID=139649 RepID=UPI0018CF67AC|nr:uncharacterized protein LOC119679643 [Teleopsis dalmanni]